MSDDRANGRRAADAPPAGTRQYVQYIFYKVDAAWRSLPAEERDAAKREAVAAVESLADRMQVRSYSLTGIRGDADFMFWQISDDLEAFQEAATRLLSTRAGPLLTTPYAYLAMTRKSVYVDRGDASADAGEARRLRLTPGTAKYLFVYPFVKTRPWYNLSLEARQAMMDAHIRIGRKYPTVKLNTTYSFGLDDQEFVVAFETDEPGDFLDLVMELRETESSLYTLRDTPTFTCVAASVGEIFDRLGAPGEAATPAREPQRKAAWTRVCAASELPAGGAKSVYYEREQVTIFDVSGTLYAVEARCPHANARLADGAIDGSVLTCSRHGSSFDLADGGCVVRGPAARGLRTYAVRIDGGDVLMAEASGAAGAAAPRA